MATPYNRGTRKRHSRHQVVTQGPAECRLEGLSKTVWPPAVLLFRSLKAMPVFNAIVIGADSSLVCQVDKPGGDPVLHGHNTGVDTARKMFASHEAEAVEEEG